MTLNLSKLDQTLQQAQPIQAVGKVVEVIGLVIESEGPDAKIGDICDIHTQHPEHPVIQAEVMGFREGRLLLMPLQEMTHLAPGCFVYNTHQPFSVNVGDELLGRILDGYGNPIDDRSVPLNLQARSTNTQAPPPLNRKMIDEALPLGVRSLDGFTTMGTGQRVGIFSGSGVGKSTLLGMAARNTDADMSVIALIGERGREVREFIEQTLESEGLKRSVVIVATSEQPALMKIKAALVATSIAEHFRDQGKRVLLMMDSLTRVAMALREVGLSVGEPPTSRGYTPSVFTFLPKLLERSGTSDHGSITGLYTVLVEGDDFNEPISDAVRGLLDGHIVLSRDLAYKNHFPSVDVLGSISRLMVTIANPEHREWAGRLRDLLATYNEAEDIINIGAYVKGANPKLDLAVAMKEEIDQFLRQDITEQAHYSDTLAHLQHLAQKATLR